MTTGLDDPGPGNAVFQAKFCVWLHFAGSFTSELVAAAFGPKNCGQSAAWPNCANDTIVRKTNKPIRFAARSREDKTGRGFVLHRVLIDVEFVLESCAPSPLTFEGDGMGVAPRCDSTSWQ